MKTNAIVRIILFSLAIIILVGILLAGLGIRMFGAFRFVGGENGIEGGTVASLGHVDAASIQDIEIEWTAGSITITPDENAKEISFQEYGTEDPDHQMVWKQSGDTLSIQFEESKVYFGIQGTSFSKDLTITVPAGWVCDTLEIDAASAEVEVTNMTINEVDFDGASGFCTFTDCTVEKFDVDTASGDVSFNGSLNVLNISAMSANCEVSLSNCPRSIDMDSMSGDLTLTLPENCGFSVTMDAMSSDFSSDFETASVNGAYVHGDGSCRINIDAMSGDVSIRKAK